MEEESNTLSMGSGDSQLVMDGGRQNCVVGLLNDVLNTGRS